MEQGRQGLDERERKRYRDLALEQPAQFGRWLGFEDLTDLHNGWIREVLLGKEDETLQGHRGSYKTTSRAVVGLSLLMILRPRLNTLLFRKTDTDVNEVVRAIGKALKHEKYQALSMKLWGRHCYLLKETESEINTSLNPSPSGASQLLGLGIKTSLTGKHGSLIMTDDIVNLKDRISRAEREEIKLYYQELQNIKNPGGRILNSCTVWHKDDATSLMPNVKRHDCYSTGLLTRLEIEDLRTKMTPSLFAANYELKLIAAEDALFSEPVFVAYAENDSEPQRVIYDGIGHIDAGYGGGDATAFTVVRKTETGYIVFGKRWEKHVDDCLGEIYNLAKYYRCGTIHLEKNADKGYLRKEVAKNHPAQNYNETMNKYIKIATYLRGNWKEIKFMPETDPEYLNEILDYTEHSGNDHSPDSLASGIRVFDSKVKLNDELDGGI